jgi:hypothetical protein
MTGNCNAIFKKIIFFSCNSFLCTVEIDADVDAAPAPRNKNDGDQAIFRFIPINRSLKRKLRQQTYHIL